MRDPMHVLGLIALFLVCVGYVVALPMAVAL